MPAKGVGVKAIVVAGRDSVLMGFSIRRYAPSVPDMGAVYISPSAAGTFTSAAATTSRVATIDAQRYGSDKNRPGNHLSPRCGRAEGLKKPRYVGCT